MPLQALADPPVSPGHKQQQVSTMYDTHKIR